MPIEEFKETVNSLKNTLFLNRHKQHVIDLKTCSPFTITLIEPKQQDS
jgi:hypothetical protein